MTSSADESQGADPLFVLAGGGELGERIRAFDWSATSLGPIAGWPDSLCSALSICLQASVPCALYWGADLVLLYNDPWGSLPGVTPADCLGRPAREVWGERWPMLEPVFHRVLTLNETVRGPALPVSIPGQDFLEPGAFDELWSPVRSRSGAVEGVFHTVLDLTDRKRAAERERQLLIEAATANAQFRALFEQGALFAGIMHVDGTLLEPNRLALEACGYTREQVVGRPFWDCPWWNRSPALREQIRAATAQAAAGQTFRAELPYYVADGSERVVDLILLPVKDESGRVMFLAPTGTDVTDRKRTEEALRQSEVRYRLIGQAANDAIWDWDLVTNQATWHEGVQRLFGYSPEQIGPDASWWYEHLHPDDRDRVIEGIHAAIDGGAESWRDEYRFRRADGSYAEVLDRGQIVRDGGTPSRMIGSMFDLTEQKRTEKSLRQSEAQLRTIFEQATAGITQVDPTGRFLLANQRYCEITGYTIEELRQQSRGNITHPEDQARDRELFERAVQDHQPYVIEKRYVRKDGSPVWVRNSVSVIMDHEGKVERLLAVSLDINDRKRAEERQAIQSEQLRHLAQVATRLNTAVDIQTITQIVNEELRNLIGAHQAVTSFTTDLNWGQAINVVSLSERYAAWRDYSENPDGSGIYALVCQLNQPLRLTQDELIRHPAFKHFGRHRKNHPPIRGWLAAPLVGRDGRNIGLVQLSDKYEGDFTEEDEAIIVQLAQMASVAIENARLVQDLREADRRKDEFLATLAHELRNPLAPIRNGLQVMKLAGSDKEIAEQSRAMMERQLSQMVRLIDDLLDVSRISRGKITLQRQRVDLSTVIHQAIETSRPLIDENAHELSIQVPPEPIFVDADVTRLAQVIANLLNNAAKYTERGGQINLEVHREGNDAVITVRDSGIGIPSHLLPKLFEMFTQIDRSLERSRGGLGIGLSLVKRLVEMHGGTVQARSEGHGLGSEFIVRIPVVLSLAQIGQNAESDRPSGAVPRHRILVVDDNHDSATSLALMLKLMGNIATTAHDGLEALAVAAVFRPDVILLDIGMPKLNGYDTARRIREQAWGKNPKLIALTGWGQEEDRRRSQEAGFDDHLTKPVDPATLETLLANLLADSA